jgi:hypothetical protein
MAKLKSPKIRRPAHGAEAEASRRGLVRARAGRTGAVSWVERRVPGEGRNATGERLMQATGLLGLDGMDAVASGHTLCQAGADECIQIMRVVDGHVDATNRADGSLLAPRSRG